VARQGLASSPDIQAAQQNLRIAEQEVKRSRAGNYPTLDLVASKDRSSASSVSTINQRISQNVIGVEVSLPLFNGGYNTAQLAQSVRCTGRPRQNWTMPAPRWSWKSAGSITGEHRCTQGGLAAKAVFSSTETVKASKLGLVAGVKTLTDILNSEEQLYQARRDLLLAQYNQLVSWIALRAASSAIEQAGPGLAGPPFPAGQAAALTLTAGRDRRQNGLLCQKAGRFCQ
jgi:outer membrane protein TolC